MADDISSALNPVISICRDASEGFRGAANTATTPALKDLFAKLSAQRAQFAEQLRNLVRQSGGKPADPSGVAGKLHGGWMAIESAVTGHKDHRVLEGTERGENLSLGRYQDALQATLSADFREVLEAQQKQIREALAKIRALREEFETADTTD